MGTTLLDVCNRALSRVGAVRIAAITETNASAKAVSACFPSAPDWVLRTWRWKFAIKRTDLLSPEDATGTGWTWRYALPSDYLWMARDPSVEGNEAFSVEGRSVLSDADAPLGLRYVSQVTDAALWDPAFAEVLSWRIAMEIQPELGASVSALSLQLAFSGAVRNAQRSGAIERTPLSERTDAWLASRI